MGKCNLAAVHASTSRPARSRAAIPIPNSTVHRVGFLMVATTTLAKPAREVGSFVALSLDIMVQAVRPPFAWREFVLQVWFIARVSTVPGLLLTIPFCVITALHINVLLIDIGAADLSGTAAGLAITTQIGPIVTVFVVAGTASTAVCADLGARTIREEIDAMRVMGVNPVQALLVPRVAALTVCSTLLNAVVCTAGLGSSYFFAVYVSHVTPGAYAAGMPLLCGFKDVTLSFAKATLFGLAAALIACYKGTTPSGGPQSVGNAVNETVVYAFMALVFILLLMDILFPGGLNK